MDLKEKLTNRFNIIRIILLVLIILLSLRLAVLTIAQGDYYRNIADNKRLKEIKITPPRGEIRDRHGRLLAGNKPSFTVQLLKDELNIKDIKKKSASFLTLIRYLEEDGANYSDEFPIELNKFSYGDKDYLSKNLSPIDEIMGIILDNDLISTILNSYYISEDYDEHYKFITANRAMNALNQKGIDTPMEIKLVEDNIVIEYQKNKDIKAWKMQYNLSPEDSAIVALEKLVKTDKAILRNTIDHSIARELTYNILASQGLIDGVILNDYSISYMEDYIDTKRKLMKVHSEISMESTAKDDFINIFKEYSLKNFLEKPILVGKNEILPGDMLLEMNREKGGDIPIEISISEDGLFLVYKYTGSGNIREDDLVDMLIAASEKNKVLDYFIIDDLIKALAQEQILNDGINPKISIVNNIEYAAINSMKNFYKGNNVPEDAGIKEAFEILKKNYKIEESLSKYEARSIMVIHTQLKK